MEEEQYYRIYGKFKGQKQFKAMDLSKGCQVGNLFYASFFIEKENAEKALKSCIDNNPDWQFEMRKV